MEQNWKYAQRLSRRAADDDDDERAAGGQQYALPFKSSTSTSLSIGVDPVSPVNSLGPSAKACYRASTRSAKTPFA